MASPFSNWANPFPICKVELSCKDTFVAPRNNELRGVGDIKIRLFVDFRAKITIFLIYDHILVEIPHSKHKLSLSIHISHINIENCPFKNKPKKRLSHLLHIFSLTNYTFPKAVISIFWGQCKCTVYFAAQLAKFCQNLCDFLPETLITQSLKGIVSFSVATILSTRESLGYKKCAEECHTGHTNVRTYGQSHL